ncbi:hypothetical protein N2152v2_005726 [Parachlorella kessleri]
MPVVLRAKGVSGGVVAEEAEAALHQAEGYPDSQGVLLTLVDQFQAGELVHGQAGPTGNGQQRPSWAATQGGHSPAATLQNHMSPSRESLDSPIDRRSDYYRQQVLHKAIEGKGKLQAQPMLTAPNICTFLRILMVPLFVALWFHTHQYASISTALVFVLAAVTDWLDGYLARKMAIPVSIMIAREVTMASLREWAAGCGQGASKAVKVNSLGKWKTALQMVAMSALLLLRNADHILGDDKRVVDWVHDITWGAWLALWVSAVLAVWSLANYTANVWHYFRYVMVDDSSKEH